MPYQSVFRKDCFAGQVVIVTGGGSGIGRCTAHELASLGAQVVICGRSIEKLNTVAAEIAEDGGKVKVLPCDIRDEAIVRSCIAQVLGEFGRIDGLFNNAGGQYRTLAQDISTKGFEAVVRNNLTGGFIFMREAYTAWMHANGGAIVNMIADIWEGWPEFAHSGAARGGMLTLTQTLACEWARAGVRVNAVAPGGIASSGFDTYPPEQRARLRDYAAQVPMHRFGTEAEVSGAVCFLLSDAAAYMSGTCLRIDGGAPLARQTWSSSFAPIEQSAPVTSKTKAYEGFHRAVIPDLLKLQT